MDPLLASAGAASPQTWNRYAYGLNNPLRYSDPTGMSVTMPSAGGTAEDQRNEQLRQQPQAPTPAPPPIDSSMEGSPQYVEQAGVRQVVDVRQDPAIVNGIANIHGTPLTRGTAPVLSGVVPIVGTNTFVSEGAIVDAYGHVTYDFTGTVRPVAYVPVDQGGNIIGQTNELVVREVVDVVTGERPTTSGAAPQNSQGIFIDIHSIPTDGRFTAIKQYVAVDQFPGGPREGITPSARAVAGTRSNPTVVTKDPRGIIDVNLGGRAARRFY